MKRAERVAPWYSACLVYTKPLIQPPKRQKLNKNKLIKINKVKGKNKQKRKKIDKY